ncbi:hypothetical protein BBO99_00007595 [Phytophthora kernoviae]|uniref:Uncharacterized protein n=1 Tax=Phytophthora kernoviae TaxID=325452 RepID=A0A3R7HTD1_9STRA|nr:hypothetical protein BBI17_008454 [Phytophthora kernoviae]RLN76386.1 hypothetical protein BBO99_00007595 [Phytophthora kernoviae]
MKAPLLPQLDEAIAFLQADIAALRAGEKDRSLPSLAVSIAAGDAPLPEPQFAPLLSLWTPKSSTISTELAMLVDQFEAAKQHEEKGKAQAEDQDAVEPPKVLNSALERVKGRRRPRTRPRRRFEDPGEGDASQSTSDGTATPSPRVAAAVEKKTVVIETEEKAVETEEETAETEEKAAETEEETAETEEKAAETEEKAAETEEKTTETQVVVDRDQKMEEIQDEAKKEEVEKSSVEDVKISESDVEKETGESENVEMEDEEKEEETEAVVVEKVKEVIEDKVEGVPNPAKEEAEAALASLKALRKTMLLDVLSKIVSVAKSKDVDPAMFSEKGADVEKTKDKELVDLKKIHDHVTNGKICEWAEFAEQVYLFCQHVVSDAEEREQPEARRKGVELLHFARTLTETLRKGSVKKEASLVEKIREADAAATESAAHNEPEELRPSTDKEEAAPSNQDNDVTKPTTQDSPVPSPFTPSRVSKRIRKRSSEIDGTSSAAPSPSPQNPRKRTRGASSAASASEDVSGSESHDASASEADLKSRGPS